MDEHTISQDDEQQHNLQQQLEVARQQAAENRDKYLRALAEAENMRKRVERLCDERMWQEKKRLLTGFLEIADQLEEALKYVGDGDPVGAGVRATYQQLEKLLTQEGVRSVESVGGAFDPNIHEAVELTDDEGEPNQVTHEYRKGYMLNDRLLRPARVQVRRSS